MNNANSGEIRKGSPLDQTLNRLESVEPLSSGGYQALCPAHDDNEPSLSISEGENERVLLQCHAGCDTREVVNALGLELKDLFPEGHDASWTPWEGTEEGVYTYLDAEGQPLFQVVRFEMQDPSHPASGEKKFLQRSHEPGDPEAGQKGCPDGYVWGRRGTEPTLYRLPRVKAATKRGEPVYFVEGEKDVETLESVGLTATTIPGGAGSAENWTEGMSEVLASARVFCIPDNDEAGRDFIQDVANRLVGEAREVRILHLPSLPPKGDVSDWLENGGSPDRLNKLAREADVFVPTPETTEELIALCEREEDEAIIFDNIQLVAEVPAEEYPTLKRRLKETTDVNLNELSSAVKAARKRLEAAREKERREKRREQLESGESPTVVVTGRPSSEIVDDICKAVEKANEPPTLFRREGDIVRVRSDEADRVRIVSVSDALFDDWVSRGTVCTDGDYKPRDPSKRLVERVAERVELPWLHGLTRVPILRPDGSVMAEQGYDPETQLLYRAPPGSEPSSVPEAPTEDDVSRALEWLREAWIDHPYASDASSANALALALTPTVRPLLGDANVPLCIIDATRAGSGKSLLAEIIGTMAIGQTPATMSAPRGDEEWRKQITAQLSSGERFIVVDDVTGTLDSSSLRRVITSSAWSDRILGVSRQVRLPATATWCATGNNLRPRGDMIRRCFLIRLDTGMVRPWKREEFKHDQPEWTRRHRGILSASLLTLARAWIDSGRPEPDAPSLGSFERWRTVVGGILQHAGVEGFLQNLDELQETEFSEDREWRGLLEAIFEWQDEILDADTFTARDLADLVETRHSATPSDRSRIAEEIAKRLPEDIQTKIRHQEPITKPLGKSFAYRKGRRFRGGWYIEKAGEGREGAQWQVRCSERDDDHDIVKESSSHAHAPNPSSPDVEGGEGKSASEADESQSHSRMEEAPF